MRSLLIGTTGLLLLLGFTGAANAQTRSFFRIKNDGRQTMTVQLRYVNKAGQVRTLRADRQPTIAPGEEAFLPIPHDIATVRQGSQTRFLVAIRGSRTGKRDVWWGVRSQDGRVADRGQFTGLGFRAFVTQKNGVMNRYLAYSLRL